MKTCNFISFGINNDIESTYLNCLFESAWDTLSKLYPNYHLEASDCYVIYAFDSNSLLNDDYEDINYAVFNIGINNYIPALQNIETKEIIPIRINKYCWY
ncbi:hypothetical protein [uncultured Bacteroides sp.]|uniref:hypothetical protein n=1 Tax=uncultured Bacteroides sp. TaxID=162156 RepID=UPI0025937C2A|nr:hypothetical protein [uncultured Bacteroides sp.]